MGRGGRMRELLKSQIFWFIWLNCASKETSLFEIQKRWRITSNFLYHKHKRLKKTYVELMINEGFIEKIDKKLRAKFEWIEEYIREYYKGTVLERYSSLVAKFCIKYREILFDFDNLKTLFKNEENWKLFGSEIFRYVFFALVYKDVKSFLKEHRAEGVMMLIDLIVHFSNKLNLLSYSQIVSEKIIEHIGIISTKKDVEDIYNLIKQNK